MHCPMDTPWTCIHTDCGNNNTRCCSPYPNCKSHGGVLPQKYCPASIDDSERQLLQAEEIVAKPQSQMVCPSQYCANGGNCTVGCDGTFKCICPNSFVGETCRFPGCSDYGCQNNGQCILTAEYDRICKCPMGYFGDKCEFSICTISPCANGGECSITGMSNVSCNCKNGYDGEFCQKTPCTFGPCLNDGICFLKVFFQISKLYLADQF